MTAPDAVDTYLAEVREAIRQRDELVARARIARVNTAEFNAAQDRLAEPAPHLLAAVEAVLALTRDTDGNDLPGESEVPVGEFARAIYEALEGAA